MRLKKSIERSFELPMYEHTVSSSCNHSKQMFSLYVQLILFPQYFMSIYYVLLNSPLYYFSFASLLKSFRMYSCEAQKHKNSFVFLGGKIFCHAKAK